MGHIYKRGKIYWVKYYRNKKPVYESTKTTKYLQAKRYLREKEGDIAHGKADSIRYDEVFFEDLVKLIKADYQIKGNRSTRRLEQYLSHLEDVFGGWKVIRIDKEAIDTYTVKRQEEGAGAGTIRGELSTLRRMFRLGAQAEKVNRIPFFSMPSPAPPKEGFFEHDEFEAVRDRLPDYLKGFVTFGYKTGWRFGEVSSLTWNRVKFKQRRVYLSAEQSKNKETRYIHLDNELLEIFQEQRAKQKKAGTLGHWVFPNRSGKGPITDFRKVWNRAFKELGIERRTFHDFRRTAARNLVRARIPEKVAMQITGHKTRLIFDRYNITSENDLKEASERLDKYINEQATVTKKLQSEKVVDLEKKRDSVKGKK